MNRNPALALLVVLAGVLACGTAQAADPLARGAARPPGGPDWTQLSGEQREALAPLAQDWPGFDADRKKKWLEIAVRYKDLSRKASRRCTSACRTSPA